MRASSQWCPFCSFPNVQMRDQKALCTQCAGTGRVHCPKCCCDECDGSGLLVCPDCSNGRVACPSCNRAGKNSEALARVTPTKGVPLFRASDTGRFSLLGRCKVCDGVGVIYHEQCLGRGMIPCQTCLGIGHSPDCTRCGGSGTIPCPSCYSAGLEPSSHVVEHALLGAMAHLMEMLPVVPPASGSELFDLSAAIRRITAFLAIYHFAPSSPDSDREHQMIVLEERLNLQVALLEVRDRSHVFIRYHFLDVRRTAASSFQLDYKEHQKEWR